MGQTLNRTISRSMPHDMRRATAAALGCSTRTLAYMLPAARRRLADVLDRRDLL